MAQLQRDGSVLAKSLPEVDKEPHCSKPVVGVKPPASF